MVKGLLFVFFLASLSLFGQEHPRFTTNTTVAEKVYLQLGAQAYATDQTLWFKAIVTDAENNVPSDLSRVLYVDLIDPNEQIVAHELIKLEQGIGHGSLELRDDLAQGRYLIRAYTQWNRNFGDDFIFKTYISVYPPKNEGETNPIGTLTLIEQEVGEFFLTGELHPQKMGGPAEKSAKVYLDWGQGKDTITVKRKGKASYPLAYRFGKKPTHMTLTLENGAGSRHTKTLVLKDSLPDVRFFPESGNMVSWLS